MQQAFALRAQLVAQGVRAKKYREDSVGKNEFACLKHAGFTEQGSPGVLAERKLKTRFMAMKREQAAHYVAKSFEVGACHSLVGSEIMHHRFLIKGSEKVGRALLVGIAYKNLPEALVVHHAHQTLYPLGVELVKNVVKQQNGLAS